MAGLRAGGGALVWGVEKAVEKGDGCRAALMAARTYFNDNGPGRGSGEGAGDTESLEALTPILDTHTLALPWGVYELWETVDR